MKILVFTMILSIFSSGFAFGQAVEAKGPRDANETLQALIDHKKQEIESEKARITEFEENIAVSEVDLKNADAKRRKTAVLGVSGLVVFLAVPISMEAGLIKTRQGARKALYVGLAGLAATLVGAIADGALTSKAQKIDHSIKKLNGEMERYKAVLEKERQDLEKLESEIRR